MPKKTFLNLTQDKQDVIMNAALNEFSIHSLDEALVSNIIEEANISRGSFYKYFENIEDLYVYFFTSIKTKGHTLVFRALQETNFELFEALEVFISYLANNQFDSTYRSYFKVMSLSTNYKTSLKLLSELYDDNRRMDFSKFKKMVNVTSLKIKNDEQFNSFLKTLMIVIHELINEYFINDWPTDKLLNEYKLRISWLKNGVVK